MHPPSPEDLLENDQFNVGIYSQAAHMGYFISGRMKVVMDNGEEMEYGPGDFAIMVLSR
jgi:uncharacterized cupin superfamily protein